MQLRQMGIDRGHCMNGIDLVKASVGDEVTGVHDGRWPGRVMERFAC